MPCSEPHFPELEAHQRAAIRLLCEAVKLLRDADLMIHVSDEMREWIYLHDILDKNPGYSGAQILEEMALAKKGKKSG